MNATTDTNTPWAALPVLLAGAFMVVLDFFIVNVALPSIATDLGAGDSSLEWVVAGYGLTFAAFLIIAGRLGDELGRRRVYAIGLGLFTVASAACGLAPSPTTLVLARVAQGTAGAVVMPQVLGIVGVTYRGPDSVRAMSLYGLALGLAAVGGQVIGGALVESDLAGLGWRSCFLINVPIGIAALAFTPALVPASRAKSTRRPRRAWRRAVGRRAHGGASATDPGPRAGLAGVDLGLAGRLPAVARSVPAPPAAPRRERWRSAVGSPALRGPRVLSRARDPAVPGRSAGLLLRVPGLLSPGRPRTGAAGDRPGVHDPG